MKNTALNEVLSTVAEVELVYKSKVKPSERPAVKKSNEVYKLLLDTWEGTRLNYRNSSKFCC